MLNGPTIGTTFTLYAARLMAEHRLEDDDDRFTEETTCVSMKHILVLDFVWNLAFVLVAAAVLLSTLNERPSTPLRLWLCGYAFECILHMGFVYFKYWRRTNDDYGAESGLSLSQGRNRYS